MVRVLFVCLGNICRSPTAEGVFRALIEREGLADQIQVDSAGTHDYHVNKPPDTRAQAAAQRRGIDIGGLRGRQVGRDDLERFDYVLAMDRENLEHLLALSSPEHRHKVQLFLEYAPQRPEREVPDPYYGGAAGFDRVLDMLSEASLGLLSALRARHF